MDFGTLKPGGHDEDDESSPDPVNTSLTSFNPLTDFHYFYSGGGKLSQVMPLGKAFEQVTGNFAETSFLPLPSVCPSSVAPRAPASYMTWADDLVEVAQLIYMRAAVLPVKNGNFRPSENHLSRVPFLMPNPYTYIKLRAALFQPHSLDDDPRHARR